MLQSLRQPQTGLIIAALSVLVITGGLAARRSVPQREATAASAAMAAPAPRSAAEQRMAEAEAETRNHPEDLEAYHRLALAQMQAQRETGDPALYGRAEQSLLEAKRRAPNDYRTRRLLAWVLAGQHRFDEALALARACARENPNDFWNYGVIGDALTETGDYPGAAAAVQKMVDLRPNSLSYTRVAHQRRLRGDLAGALEIYSMALDATSPADRESIAWQRTQRGEIRFLKGDLDGADAEYAVAVQQVPDYHLALAGQARVLAARGRLSAAAATYGRALKRVQRPDWMAELGDVYLAMGQPEQAEAQYRATEVYLNSRRDDPTADATHQLAQFLADRGREPARALALAREEAADAQDIRAFDTLSWAMYHAGRYAEAWKASEKALRLGTSDPKLLYHAGMVASRLPGRKHEAAALLRRALALNPNWDVLDAPAARRALERMDSGGRVRLAGTPIATGSRSD